MPAQWESVRTAIQVFDDRLQWLKPLRDLFEHLEDYALDSNQRRSEKARLAAEALFAAVKATYDSLKPGAAGCGG